MNFELYQSEKQTDERFRELEQRIKTLEEALSVQKSRETSGAESEEVQISSSTIIRAEQAIQAAYHAGLQQLQQRYRDSVQKRYPVVHVITGTKNSGRLKKFCCFYDYDKVVPAMKVLGDAYNKDEEGEWICGGDRYHFSAELEPSSELPLDLLLRINELPQLEMGSHS